MNLDGTFEIVAMEVWSKEALDLVVPGAISIKGHEGTLPFICVAGDMDTGFER
jgi:hypothetical protein